MKRIVEPLCFAAIRFSIDLIITNCQNKKISFIHSLGIIAHGSAQLLRERLFESSDKYSTYICDLCGLICNANEEEKQIMCNTCRQSVKISKIDLPYSMKLLIQELMSMSIAPRLYTDASHRRPQNAPTM